jgi:hypothetical protein
MTGARPRRAAANAGRNVAEKWRDWGWNASIGLRCRNLATISRSGPGVRYRFRRASLRNAGQSLKKDFITMRKIVLAAAIATSALGLAACSGETATETEEAVDAMAADAEANADAAAEGAEAAADAAAEGAEDAAAAAADAAAEGADAVADAAADVAAAAEKAAE